MTVKHASKEPTPEAQLRSYIARLDPKKQKLVRAVRAALRKRLPTANELAYDYKRFFVLGYSPTERGIDAIVALAARDTGISLYFSQGPKLSDPKRLLQGSGKQTRFIQVEAASQLALADVKAFMAATIEQAKVPLPAKGKGRLILMANTKPRRKPTTKRRPP